MCCQGESGCRSAQRGRQYGAHLGGLERPSGHSQVPRDGGPRSSRRPQQLRQHRSDRRRREGTFRIIGIYSVNHDMSTSKFRPMWWYDEK